MFKMLKNRTAQWIVAAAVFAAAAIVFPPAGFVATALFCGSAGVVGGYLLFVPSSKGQEKEQSRARREQFMESLNKQTPEAGRNRSKQSPENDNQVENKVINSEKKGNSKSAKSPNDLVNAVQKQLDESKKQKNAPD